MPGREHWPSHCWRLWYRHCSQSIRKSKGMVTELMFGIGTVTLTPSFGREKSMLRHEIFCIFKIETSKPWIWQGSCVWKKWWEKLESSEKNTVHTYPGLLCVPNILITDSRNLNLESNDVLQGVLKASWNFMINFEHMCICLRESDFESLSDLKKSTTPTSSICNWDKRTWSNII